MSELPKEVNVVKTLIEELPNNEFRASYFIGDDLLVSAIFPDADKYKNEDGTISTNVYWALFLQLTLCGPIPSILGAYAKLTPEILSHIPNNSILRVKLTELLQDASTVLCLEPCTCEFCSSFNINIPNSNDEVN